ncbi:MAG: Fur family transcriptional regulator [Bacilli bacterium]
MKRLTMQKEIILEAVNELACHVTSEMVFDHIHSSFPHISKATVYRNLRSLAEDNLIRKISLPGEVDRFDHIVIPHYHARCNCCGKIFDVAIKTKDNLNESVILPDGFKSDDHEILFTGLCKSCLEKHKS